MSRNFPDFLTAYMDYADNKFAPRVFHLWSAVSILAGAMERKCYLPWDSNFAYHPNMFILLVAHPGIGKSSALTKAVDLLQDMNTETGGGMHMIPSQVTEAKFIDLMSQSQPLEIGTKVMYHSSGYYFASEASNSLKNVYGDFIGCITDFYDCPKFWEKATQKDGKLTLTNVCFNLLAGCTFDYLSKLVTDDNIMGGFASRVTYIIFQDDISRQAKFQSGHGGQDSPERLAYRANLIEDLGQIHKLKGAFQGTDEFAACYEAWYPKYEAERNAIKSEKMKSLLVRKETALMKLCMILSASEGDDLLLKPHHWETALEMIDEVEKDLPAMLRESKSRQTDKQDGLNQAIFRFFVEHNGEVLQPMLTSHLMLRGFQPERVAGTLTAMVRDETIMMLKQGDNVLFTLLVDPNAYL